MRKARRLPLLVVLLVVLVVTGAVMTLRPSTNPSHLPSGLAVSMNAESTALYCTGLSSGAGRPGRVTFYNTASVSRRLSVSVVSDKGNTYTSSIELAGHAAQSIEPSVVDKGSNFGVAVQISGGGVVGEEIAGSRRAEVPCVAAGVTHWYATGFNTLVGSSAYLSVYNPTATSAVLNASVYTASGFSAPQSFQGLFVPAHSQTEIDLGTEIVNTANVGVAVSVLGGSIDIVGVQDSNGVVSLVPGTTSVSNETWFPTVTTAQSATAQIRVANPNNVRVQVTLDVALGSYRVAPQTLTLAPFSTGLINVTPNPAIPAAGYASLTLRSSEPVISALATGTGSWIALSSPETPDNAFLVRNFTGFGFDAATVTNTSSRTLTLTISSLSEKNLHSVSAVGGIKLSAGATMKLSTIVPSLTTSTSETFIVSSAKASLVVALTLSSEPRGVNVVAPLNGR